MAQSVDIYRQEIIESEKIRADFMKWKMIIVGAIGSAGLGLSGRIAHTEPELILCLIPLTCIYIDVLCYQQSLRAFVIAKFITDTKDIEPMNKLYEELCQRKHKEGLFKLEDFVLRWSTIVLSVLLAILIAALFSFQRHPEDSSLGSAITLTTVIVIFVASLIAVVGLFYIHNLYSKLQTAVTDG